MAVQHTTGDEVRTAAAAPESMGRMRIAVYGAGGVAAISGDGDRAYLSGHLPLEPDGALADPVGKVRTDVTLEQGVAAARLVALAAIGSLRRELGDLDRVVAWLRVFAMVNTAPGFTKMATVANGFSETVLEVFGRDVGLHSRSAVGVAELPFGVPEEIDADVEIR